MTVTGRLSDDEINFAYDLAGNMTIRDLSGSRSLSFLHDAWGRLTQVKYSSNSGSTWWDRATYRYNPMSMRVMVDRDANVNDGTGTVIGSTRAPGSIGTLGRAAGAAPGNGNELGVANADFYSSTLV